MPSIVINIYQIKINSLENASAFNVGQNLLADWAASDKRNQGYGQNYGDDASFSGTTGMIDDRDRVDAPARKLSAYRPNALWREES